MYVEEGIPHCHFTSTNYIAGHQSRSSPPVITGGHHRGSSPVVITAGHHRRSSPLVLGIQYINQVLQWCQLLLVNKTEFLDEEDEMLE